MSMNHFLILMIRNSLFQYYKVILNFIFIQPLCIYFAIICHLTHNANIACAMYIYFCVQQKSDYTGQIAVIIEKIFIKIKFY